MLLSFQLELISYRRLPNSKRKRSVVGSIPLRTNPEAGFMHEASLTTIDEKQYATVKKQ